MGSVGATKTRAGVCDWDWLVRLIDSCARKTRVAGHVYVYDSNPVYRELSWITQCMTEQNATNAEIFPDQVEA